jgi:hypothetical protein
MELEAAKRPINWIGSGLLAKNLFEAIDRLIATRAAFFRTQVRLQIFFKCPPGSIMIVRRLAFSSRRSASCCPGTALTLVSDLA